MGYHRDRHQWMDLRRNDGKFCKQPMFLYLQIQGFAKKHVLLNSEILFLDLLSATPQKPNTFFEIQGMDFPVGQLQTIDSPNWMVLVDTDIPRWGIWVLVDLGFFPSATTKKIDMVGRSKMQRNSHMIGGYGDVTSYPLVN